ncbi:hypothetical protein Taro_052881, partial [Colocasia esculenta]|nr:hypothetical protein [Colocasia esculenta]
MLQALRQKMEKWSTSVDTRPRQVDTSDRSQRNKSTDCYSRSTQDGIRWLSQGTVLPSLGQCVDTPYGQVDTLRKSFDLRFLLDTWHPREMMDQPWIVCPHTPRVSLDYLGYKYPPIGHPSHQSLQKPVLAERRVHLPAPALLVFPEANSHLSNDEKWCLIIEEAVGSLQGSRSSGSNRLRRPQGRSQSSEYRASAWDFKNSSLFPIRSSTREYN